MSDATHNDGDATEVSPPKEQSAKKPIELNAAPQMLEDLPTAETSAVVDPAPVKKADAKFSLLKISTQNPNGEQIGFFICFQVTKSYSPETVQQFFEENRHQFGINASAVKEEMTFESFSEMEAYVHDKSTVNWNKRDVYVWPAQQFPELI